jgi:hypothetical protein
MNGLIRIARRSAALARPCAGARPGPAALDDRTTRVPFIARRPPGPAGSFDPVRGG